MARFRFDTTVRRKNKASEIDSDCVVDFPLIGSLVLQRRAGAVYPRELARDLLEIVPGRAHSRLCGSLGSFNICNLP